MSDVYCIARGINRHPPSEGLQLDGADEGVARPVDDVNRSRTVVGDIDHVCDGVGCYVGCRPGRNGGCHLVRKGVLNATQDE